jgi:hypothetical protein
MRRTTQTSPISFPVDVTRLPAKGVTVSIDADERQRVALAQAHGVDEIAQLRVEATVAPWKRNGVKISGTVTGKVGQTCVVSLEPMESLVSEEIEGVFLPEESRLGRQGIGVAGEIVLDVDGPDSPETFSGNTIDVGALAEQFFGLGIDPYPRKSGARLQSPAAPDDTAEPAAGGLGDKLRRLLDGDP